MKEGGQNMKKWCFSAMLLLLLAIPWPAQAAANVRVSLPDYAITLNGMTVDNAHRQYPLLMYQGMTYFPLTYDDSRFMGLETSWTENEGLTVEQTGVSAIYREKAAGKNNRTGWAEIVDFPITIHGEKVESGSKYPFLNYQGVTYLPLEWHYSTELFGWEQHFDRKQGLTLSTPNPQINKIAARSLVVDSFLLMEDHLLLQDGRDCVSISLADPQERKVLLTVPLLEDGNYQLGAFEQAGEEYYFEISPSGRPGNVWERYHIVSPLSVERVPTEQGSFTYGQTAIIIEDVAYGATGNLYLQQKGGEKRAIGSPKYRYRALDKDSLGGSLTISGVHFVDERTIVLLASDPAAENGADALCKVDLKSGETTVLKEGIGQVALDGQTAYYREHYASDACGLYQLSLVTGISQRVELPQPYAQYRGDFAALNGQLYYQDNAISRPPLSVGGGTPETWEAYALWEQTLGGTHGLYRLGETEPINPGAEVVELRQENGYLYSLFINIEETPAQPYQLMVFDRAGQTVFKTTDPVQFGMIQEDDLVYTLNTDQGGENVIYYVDLN